MKYYPLRFGLLIAFFVLMSCQEEVGINGIVRDKQTGACIEGVKIKMESDYKTLIVFSDSSGYFYTKKIVKCGAKKCSGEFTVEFDMEGYDHLELDQNYLSDTIFVDSIYNAFPSISLNPEVYN